MSIVFAERLRELRQGKGFNQSYLAKYMGVTQVTVSNWERGFKEPNYQALIDLANLFGVSCDYILGASDEQRIR